MFGKKGQLTIFIILTIVIIGLVVGFFAFRGSLEGSLFSSDGDSVKVFVEECLDEVSKEVAYSIGQGGGYFFPVNFSTETGIPYYYVDGKNYMPTKKEVEDEISLFVSGELYLCVGNFSEFQDFEISEEFPSSKTTIRDEEILIKTDYPISVTKGESTILLKEFKTEVPIRLGIVYDAVDRLMQEQVSHKSICISCLLAESTENDLYVDMIDYDETTTIFIFTDENSIINDEYFEWMFANKYELATEEELGLE